MVTVAGLQSMHSQQHVRVAPPYQSRSYCYLHSGPFIRPVSAIALFTRLSKTCQRTQRFLLGAIRPPSGNQSETRLRFWVTRGSATHPCQTAVPLALRPEDYGHISQVPNLEGSS